MHPNATAALNDEATRVFSAFTREMDLSSAREWAPKLFSQGEISEKDIEGVLRIQSIDGRSLKEVRFQVADTSNGFSLDDEGCQQLETLCRKLSCQSEYSEKVTSESVRVHVEDWLIERLWPKSKDDVSFVEYVDRRIEASVTSHEVWIPLFDIELQDDLQLGPFELKSVTAADIERIRQALRDFFLREGQQLQQADIYAAGIAKTAMGRAAVVVKSSSDLAKAQENAFIVAEKASALLRCLQPINGCCETRSYLTPLGQNSPESVSAFAFANGLLKSKSSNIASPLPFALRLSRESVAQPWMRKQLAAIGALLSQRPLSAYQGKLMHALLAYSMSATGRSPGEKLVLAFAALETLFLANDGEPIQQNLARRLAWFVEKDFVARKELVAAVKNAYRLRSKFMHHGERPNIEEFDAINRLLGIAYSAFMKALQLHEQLATMGSLGQWLDDQLLGSPAHFVDSAIAPPQEPEVRRKITMAIRTQ